MIVLKSENIALFHVLSLLLSIVCHEGTDESGQQYSRALLVFYYLTIECHYCHLHGIIGVYLGNGDHIVRPKDTSYIQSQINVIH